MSERGDSVAGDAIRDALEELCYACAESPARDRIAARCEELEREVDEAERELIEKVGVAKELLAAESLLEEARGALRPFAENWDFHAADYLAELVDGKEQRIIEASVIADIIEAVNNARAFLAKLEAR